MTVVDPSHQLEKSVAVGDVSRRHAHTMWINIFELSRLPGCLLETQGGKPIGGEWWAGTADPFFSRIPAFRLEVVHNSVRLNLDGAHYLVTFPNARRATPSGRERVGIYE